MTVFSIADYDYLVSHVLTHGVPSDDRTGVGTLRVFGQTIRHDMQDGFPILTKRKMYPVGIIGELCCFAQGLTDIREYEKRGCNYWRANLEAYIARHPDLAEGSENYLGPIYGAQWRNFGAETVGGAGVDQLAKIIHLIKTEPTSRRMVMSTWNPIEEDLMVLPPCHLLAQFYVDRGQFLDICVYQRSADLMLGVPADLVLYGLLVEAIARETGLIARQMTYHFGDVHIYKNHIEGARKYRGQPAYRLPTIEFNDCFQSALTLEPEDVYINRYLHSGRIEFPMAV